MCHDDDAKHDDGTKWHCPEGGKYAVKGIKVLLLLNGGAAVALLTLVGNLSKGAPAPSIDSALLCFGLGALAGAGSFVCAYLTQLYYGKKEWPKGIMLHEAAYVLILSSAVAFVAGLFFAWRNLPI